MLSLLEDKCPQISRILLKVRKLASLRGNIETLKKLVLITVYVYIISSGFHLGRHLFICSFMSLQTKRNVFSVLIDLFKSLHIRRGHTSGEEAWHCPPKKGPNCVQSFVIILNWCLVRKHCSAPVPLQHVGAQTNSLRTSIWPRTPPVRAPWVLFTEGR